MISQRLIWTALPNGRGGGFLTLSVMLSPRLFTDQSGTTPPLSDFSDFVDWPSTLASIQFSVQLGGGTPHPATVVTPGALAPSSSRWTALFAPTAFVRPFVYQSYAGRKVRSYPAARVRDFLRDGIYAPVMHTYATNFPSRSALVAPPGAGNGLLQPIAFGANGGTDTEDTVAAEIDAQLVAPNFAVAPGTLADPTHDFVQLHQFLAPRTIPPAGSTDGTLPGPTVPVIDFHQVVSAIGDHAALLRIFGFVVDLRVPDPGGSISTVKVIPTWTPGLAHTTNVMPSTKTDKNFLAKPSSASVPIAGGLLRLDDPSFDVLEVDTDGAAVKALSLARTLFRLNSSVTSIETPADSSVPSLRADGLGVVQSGRAYDLANLTDGTLATGDGFNALAESKPVGKITLGAESLLRGFRVDVWDDTVGRWYQLCARTAGSTGGYRVGSPPGPVIPVPAGDEGFIAMSPTTSSDSTAPNDLYLQESLFTWTGWSLSGVRPGSVLSKDPDNATVPPAGNPAATPFPLEITYAATPNTLPILRFGRTYQFRLRTVDLAGNSLAFDATTTPAKVKAVTAPLTFRRFEPVVAPMTLMRKLRTEAESVERLVVRSNYDIPDTDPSILPCERHVVPPVIAQLLAEQHGLWDLANGGPDPAAYAGIKSRDGQTFTSATTDPNNYGQPYFDVNHVTVPYNPDPLSIGAAFNALPGATAVAPITKVEFFPTGTSFPKSRAFRLAAHAGASQAPNFHIPAGGPVLDVFLPKATIATVRLSSYLSANDLELLGVWGWTSAADQSSLQSDAVDGQLWPLTPYREIIFVHAVRQPLLAPDFGSTPPLASARAIGDTTAEISGTADFDRASTDRIDVRATWNEFVDAGANPNPDVPASAAAHVGSIPIANDGSAGNTPVALVHTFGDTRHREVFYEALGTSRFTEYFVERTTIALTGTTAVTLDAGGLVDGSVVVTQPSAGGGTTTFELDVDYVVDLVAGTIARTPTSTIVSGSSVQVAYLVPPVTRSSFEGTPNGTHVTVDSSARPAAPIVRYAIPAFAFSAGTQADGTFKSVRGGNLLRIYLSRPWWSSGEGELLGVALANFVAPVAEFSTRWGRDPVFSAAGVPHVFPQISDFPLATASGVSLSIAEESGPGVNVAGHTVEYDATRDLWYSDIEIDPGSAYRPFIRLVLGRYQPDSLSGVELSRLVTIDCSQATPDRTTIVTTSAIDPNHPSVIPVSVSGYAPTGGPFGLGSVMIARVERQTFDDDLGWDQAAPEVTLGPSIVSGVTVWSGTVNRNAGPVGTYRVVVEEREQYFVDSPGGAQATRTVFLDTVLL